MRKMFFLIASCLFFLTVGAQHIPRPEYPRPQFEREQWLNLNGSWTFEFDFGRSGIDRELYRSTGFTRKIIVPFCPESKLSGVEYKDFIPAMWYHRNIDIPDAWKGKKIMLHFGAIDYYAHIYIDGISVGRHWGGSSSFSVDITRQVSEGGHFELVVYVEDDQRSGTQARGKQCDFFYSRGCDYTRTTGIWQTVWLEALDANGLQNVYVVPDLDQSRFVINPKFYAISRGQQLKITLREGKKVVANTTISATVQGPIILPIKNPKTWSPESPFLYDLEYEVINNKGEVIDHIHSYAGMRKVHIEDDRFYLNNKPCYQRLILDQGFYPDGIWTPFNEAGNPSLTLEEEKQHSRMVRDVYNLTKNLDYRPVNDVSGHFHVVTDLWTIHDYDQNARTLYQRLGKKGEKVFQRNYEKEPPYGGQPYFVAEYGGVKWVVGTQYAENTWGYGDSPQTEEEVYQRLQALTDAIRSLPHINGFCYTQLTDVEQEQNGIYNYDRTPKFDMPRIRAIFSGEPETIKEK